MSVWSSTWQCNQQNCGDFYQANLRIGAQTFEYSLGTIYADDHYDYAMCDGVSPDAAKALNQVVPTGALQLLYCVQQGVAKQLATLKQYIAEFYAALTATSTSKRTTTTSSVR